MGYTTEFRGQFNLNKKLDDKLHLFLVKFSDSRRMGRKLPPEYGIDGEFFVDGSGCVGSSDANEDSIIDYNRPPSTQPGLWCQWKPTENGRAIEWDSGEKFYEYQEWIVYIIQNFLHPAGYVLNGVTSYQGESANDFGSLIIKDNVLYDDIRDQGVLTLYVTEKPQLSQVNFIAEIKLLS
jgi:hypothetical protein